MPKSFKPERADPKLDPPPPYSSLDPKTSVNEAAATFAGRIGLFDSQGNNPDILSIIIIVLLTTANPHAQDLTLSPSTIATLSLDNNAVIKPLKRGLKRQDPSRAAEWDTLDLFLLRELLQHIFLHQDHPNNTYRAWVPTCRFVRPHYRGLGKGWLYGCTIGVAKVVVNTPGLRRWGKENRVEGVKEDVELETLWALFFGAKCVNDIGRGK